MPRQARGTCKKYLTKPTAQFCLLVLRQTLPVILLPAVSALVDEVVDVAAAPASAEGVHSRGVSSSSVGVEDDVDGAVPVRQEAVLAAAPLLAPLLVLGVARHEVTNQDRVQGVAAVSLLKWGCNRC